MLDKHHWRWGHYRYRNASEKDNSSDFYRWDKLLTLEKSCRCGFSGIQNGGRVVCQFPEHNSNCWIAVVISLLRWHEYALVLKIVGEGY